MTQQNPANSSTTSAVKRWRPGSGTVLWLILIAFVVAMSMPAIKASFYRLSGRTPPSDGIPWRTDYTAALAESAATDKPVLIDFTASWCPPCQIMKFEVWPEAAVRDLILANFIPLLLDVDQPHSMAAAQRYEVRSIPRILIVDSTGAVLKDGSFMDKSDMLAFLSRSK